MAQSRSTKIISMVKWIRTSRLSIKNSLSHSKTDSKPQESVPQNLKERLETQGRGSKEPQREARNLKKIEFR